MGVKIGNLDLGDFPLLLAPMEDVSDPPFRALCKDQGADMLYTEFISTDGLAHGAAKSIQKLDIYPEERPIGIQIFGSDEQAMLTSLKMVEEANPDVIDINYGCPVKKVVCKMAGAGILQDIPRMVRLTKLIVENTNLPVTVKTRLGWDESTKYIVEVAERLQDVGIHAISIHGRTRKQMYRGDADWRLIANTKDNPRLHIPVFGNGDIDHPEKLIEYKNKYGVDGIMIGRAAIGNPWIFKACKTFMEEGIHAPNPCISERVNTAKKHLDTAISWKGEKLGVLETRRHYGPYFRGLPGVKEFRKILVTSMNINELHDTLDEVKSRYQGY